jgi:glyoxylase-like metal-dependent hydrolase (beta-lactamase superfamily II)
MLQAAGAAEVAAALSELTLPDVARVGDGPINIRGDQLGAPGHPPLRPGGTFAAALGYEAPDEWIAAGQEFELGTRTLTAIHTPGHTRGHLVFADTAAGLLFAGDHVLPHITPSIGFEESPSDMPLRDYLQSLSIVRELPDMRLLPAHGPVSPSTHVRADELAEHHASRLAAMADVLSGGEQTAYEVARAIPWTSRRRKLADLDVMNQMLAIGETVYHLDLLIAQSLAVVETSADGVRHYQLAPKPAL